MKTSFIPVAEKNNMSQRILPGMLTIFIPGFPWEAPTTVSAPAAAINGV
ncbi:MAG: hypothetical protein KKE17_03125 [Proteobacteria bacterium]|nr:hypothetical protein [Pseudomonadota bacterium]MBU1708975.1 hypothetical protein [Pseudomonadota bacterium]